MIKVKNISNYTIYVIAADYNFHRKLNPGREISVAQEVYDELTFDLGFEKLVRGGALKVTGVNEEVSEVIDVPFETYAPADIKKMFEDKDYVNFTKMIPNASPATKETIVAVAVDMRISDKAFVELIKKYCDVNIIEAISVQVQAEEN